jgi:hypothetical protein
MLKIIWILFKVTGRLLLECLTFFNYAHYDLERSKLKEVEKRYQSLIEETNTFIKERNLIIKRFKAQLEDVSSRLKFCFQSIMKDKKVAYLELEEDEKQKLAGLSGLTEDKLFALKAFSLASISALGGSTLAGAGWVVVAALGTASTGTAIGGLSGAAAFNATLAWFGGGAIVAGGAGMAGGAGILALIVMAPVALLAGYFTYRSALKLERKRKVIEQEILSIKKQHDVAHRDYHTLLLQEMKIKRVLSTFIVSVDRTKKKYLPFGRLSEVFNYWRNDSQKVDAMNAELRIIVSEFFQKMEAPQLNNNISLPKSLSSAEAIN